MTPNRGVSWTLSLATLILLSALALTQLEFGSIPESSYILSVTTEYSGTNAKEIERVITIPLEDSISDISGIKSVSSVSEFSKSRIRVTAKRGTDPDTLYTDVRERVDRVAATFPKAVQKPRIASSDSTNRPVFIVSFRAETMGISELGEYVEDTIRPKYQRVKGTGEIETGGRGVLEVMVSIDAGKAARTGQDALSISRLIQESYARMPLGSLESMAGNTASGTAGEITSPLFFDCAIEDIDGFGALKALSPSGNAVKLSEIADLSTRYRESDQVGRIDGEKRVILYIYSGGNVNAIAVCDELVAVTSGLKQEGFDTEIIYDKGSQIRSGISRILVSMAISVLSLFLFIGAFFPDMRTRLVLSCSVPVSLLFGFTCLSVFRIPVDSSVISGMSIGSGLIIDNYLIAHDYFRKTPGRSAQPLVGPLFSGTLTTLIVFLPLLALESVDSGVKSISYSICALLAISLFLTFVYLPLPLSALREGTASRSALISIDAIARTFLALSRKALSHKRRYALTYIVIMAMVPLLLLVLDREFKPVNDERILFVHVEFPSGTTITEVDSCIAPYVSRFRLIQGVKLVESSARRGNAHVNVTFDPKKVTLTGLKDELSAITKDSPKARFFLGLDQETDSYTVSFTLTGSDHAKLREQAKILGESFSKEAWIRSVIYHVKEDPPAKIFVPRVDRLAEYEMTADRVASIVRWNVQGPVSLKWIFQGKERDVRVGYRSRALGLYDLPSIPVVLGDSVQVPLSALGSFVDSSEPERLYRDNRQCSVSLSVSTERIGLSRLNASVRDTLRSFDLPAGFGIFPDSSISDTIRDYRSMFLAFAFSVFLIYVVLAVQNESFLVPLPIISSIPFSAFLPLLLLFMTGQPLTAATIIGIIILSGTSVNSYILIVDDISRDSSGQLDEEKILSALASRFNPLFLSCGTSVIAAIPILISSRPFSDFPSALSIVMTLGIAASFFGSFAFFPCVIGPFLRYVSLKN